MTRAWRGVTRHFFQCDDTYFSIICTGKKEILYLVTFHSVTKAWRKRDESVISHNEGYMFIYLRDEKKPIFFPKNIAWRECDECVTRRDETLIYLSLLLLAWRKNQHFFPKKIVWRDRDKAWRGIFRVWRCLNFISLCMAKTNLVFGDFSERDESVTRAWRERDENVTSHYEG